MEIEEQWVGDEGGSSSSPNKFMESSIGEIIEEDQEIEILGTIKEESKTIGGGFGGDDNDDNVYVAVGKSNTSMDALRWALKNSLKPSSSVFLIHVFPEVHHIPTALGKFPRSQASTEQVENYMNLERSKRIELLSKFLNLCSQVRVDTILIESDHTAKAVLDLIPVLNIRKLVLGTNKSSLKKGRKKGIADVVQRDAPEYCEVSIICEGKDVSREMMMMGMPTTPTHTTMGTPSPSYSHSQLPPYPDGEEAAAEANGGGGGGGNEDAIKRTPRHSSHSNNKNHHKKKGKDDSFSLCMCFFSKST
ncbi:U-box domain-containing protein 37-like [Telopea speciosissima]|uniref:U-box domain-containing protein 37-like n=1 Tax=Telopea speciosissima TaxID=54955 RepID=UPI001CC463B9|nr:U-box domain-containing protein 37-like [Telopea speciosissima]